MKNYELELPQNYKAVKVIDAKEDKKVVIIFNIVALLVMAISVAIAWILVGDVFGNMAELGYANLIRVAVFLVVMIAYIILHELVHGAMYKALTKQKLTFGLTLSVAFCGVPNIYVYRRTALLAVLAPFAVFLPVFTVLPIVLTTPVDKILASFMWGMHVGGCVGDLYVAGLLLFKYRDKTVLMNDTGPKQTFYVLDETAEQTAE